MPLEKGSSREAISRNIKTEVEHGHPQQQAVAIAMRTAGKSNQDQVIDDPRVEKEVIPTTVTLSELNAANRSFWQGQTGDAVTPTENDEWSPEARKAALELKRY